LDCPDAIKFQVIDELKDYFRKRYDIIDIDGVRIPFNNGWGLVRASNTQPGLVLRFEANTEYGLHEIRSLIEEVLKGIMKKFS
jgi:phosphomannomutase/phosphoglucomutase